MLADNDDGVGGDQQGSVSKITLTRQWAGGGAGSDAADGGGVAAAEAPIAVRGCTDRRERRGGRERDLRINGEAIIESAYAYAPIMAG